MSCCGKSNKKPKKPSKFKHYKPKTLTAQSIALKTFLLCRPNFFGINYSINPWMNINNKSDQNKAIEQWDNLKDRIEEYSGAISFIKPQIDLPDMVFTANGGLLIKEQNLFIVSNFKFEERKRETFWFHQFFKDRGLNVYIPINDFEGAGDALYLGGNLICAHGFRTDESFYNELRNLNIDFSEVKLIEPRYYHLDTCFCTLSDNDYLIFPDAFDQNSLDKIRSFGFNEIQVNENEAIKFACNSVAIGKTILMPNNCNDTAEKLRKLGYNVVFLEMSEFLKSGGAVKCLTLEI